MDGDIEVREVSEMADLEDVFRMIDAIWRPEPSAIPVSREMMRALSHAGNYVAAAYQNGQLTGISIAFLSDPPGTSLHSHITGAVGGRGVGRALKLHQREWALRRGLSRITWTYDPLVRRNAHFNLTRLAATADEYLPSFYGTMSDAINSGDETDRVLAVWHLSDPAVVAAASGIPHRVDPPAGAVRALSDQSGRPVIGSTRAPAVLVEVPEDIERLRQEDPGAAKAWRLAMREVLAGLLAEGARVTGFHNRSCYVVARPEESP
jgi:predicted GNAT superfamily acetyltransferase